MMSIFKKRLDVKSYQIDKDTHITDMMLDLKKRKRNSQLQFVASEIAANIIEANEKATLIVNGSMLQAIIDKKNQALEKFEKLKASIEIAKNQKNNNPIVLENGKTGGYGTKMILNSGYNIEYKDCDDFFFLVAYKEI